ncbi:MAG: mercury transporter [Bdellovibrio sp. CG10_big_fil_rev_8_21_14_0_10_47_8]|nr:MAG: mercury transporter [Bdellovibrio sp. CG10_big_fil_rev_8_21_14_0_10_47_8]
MADNKLENKSGWLVGGGLLAAIISSLCCIGPLILTVLGVSGAAALSKFETIRVPMIIVVFVLFGIAGFALYRKRNSCAPDSICADPKKYRQMVLIYWAGLATALLGITSPQWVPWLF